PLADYRPLVWMSLPRRPFSSAAELERLATPIPVETFASPAETGQLTVENMWLRRRPFDSIWTAKLHPHQHGENLRTGADGRAILKALIPGATYRITQFDGKTRDFTVDAGETVELGDVTIYEPGRAQDLPAETAAHLGRVSADQTIP